MPLIFCAASAGRRIEEGDGTVALFVPELIEQLHADRPGAIDEDALGRRSASRRRLLVGNQGFTIQLITVRDSQTRPKANRRRE